MKSRRLVELVAACAALLPIAGSVEAAEIRAVRSGWTAVHFYADTMEELGMQFSRVNATVTSPDVDAVLMESPDLFFSISAQSGLQFKTFDGKLYGGDLTGGALVHEGGLSVTAPASGVVRDMRDFVIGLDASSANLGLTLANGVGLSKSAFEIAYPRYNYDPSTAVLILGPMDLKLTAEFAVSMGKPELAHRTIGQYLEEHRFSDSFRDNYLIPMAAAIWSTPRIKMLDYPAATFVSSRSKGMFSRSRRLSGFVSRSDFART